MEKYNTNDIKNCDYKVLMLKTYSKEPEVVNGKCFGFRNKYDGTISKVCDKCINLMRS